MRVLGLIAEYNPFHLGHLYHLNQAKRISSSDGVIAILSGSFLQRGEPAIIDKWVRTEMALKSGIDLVLELPVVFASRSAYWFAQGGVKSLAASGIISHLAFGAETNHLLPLKSLAQKLNNEDQLFTQILNEFLGAGYSYPKSRNLALQKLLPDISLNLSELDKPNNVLALAYLRVLEQLKSPIEPILIKRIGSYRGLTPKNGIASATAIRQLIINRNPTWVHYLPETSSQLLLKKFTEGKGPITLKSLEQAILAVIRRMSLEDIKNIIEVTEGLENRLQKLVHETGDIDKLLEKLKTKRYTYTRMERLLIHAFLNFTQNLSFDEPQYLRVLGFNQQGKELLRLMKQHSSLPIITKFAQGFHQVSEQGRKMLDLEIQATDLYHLGFSKPEHRLGRQDFYRSPVILD